MAIRIENQVVRGKLDNARRGFVGGWIELVDDTIVQLELTGNLPGQFQGHCLEFQAGVSGTVQSGDLIGDLAGVQTGKIGDVAFHQRRIPRCGIQEFVQGRARGEASLVNIKPCLYLEWYGPDGRVVIELVDPVVAAGVQDVEAEPLPRDVVCGESVDFVSLVDGVARQLSAKFQAIDRDDPYGLFPRDSAPQFRLCADVEQPSMETSRGTSFSRQGWRDWDEVIPSLDPDTKKQYELWDEIIYDEEKHVPLMTLFDPPLKLPPVGDLDEQQATALVDKILTELEKFSIVLEICEHFSDLDCYRLLVEEILPEARISPRQPESGFVTHYTTWDSCPKCQAEFDNGD